MIYETFITNTASDNTTVVHVYAQQDLALLCASHSSEIARRVAGLSLLRTLLS
jgi:hypothetical protein